MRLTISTWLETTLGHLAGGLSKLACLLQEERFEDIVADEKRFFDSGGEIGGGLHRGLLTDAREGIAYEHVDDACTAVAGVDDDGVGRLLADLPDDACFFASLDKLDGVEGDIS